MIRLSFFIWTTILVTTSAWAGYWTVITNEPDPFDKTKGTFVATTGEDGHRLAARCLEGELSFAVIVNSGGLNKSDIVSLRIIADDKEPISEIGGVVSDDKYIMAIQFGTAVTFEYLQDVKKFYLRLTTDRSTETFGFTGGPTFDSALHGAKRACGVETAPAPDAPPAVDPKSPSNYSANAATIRLWSGKDCAQVRSCALQLTCLSVNNQLGADPDEDGFLNWCRRQPGMRF